MIQGPIPHAGDPRRGRRRPEESLQRLVVDWLVWNRGQLGCLALHIPNQSASGIQRAVNAGLGALPGAPDLLLLPTWEASARGARILHLELKSKRGVQSQAQEWFQGIAEEAGHLYRIARTLEEAIAAMKEAGLYPMDAAWRKCGGEKEISRKDAKTQRR